MAYVIDLAGKTAIVTGGTRGIGRAISQRLAEAGAWVAMLYRGDDASAQEAAATLQSISALGHIAVRGDLANRDEAAGATREAVAALGGALDILILNAGVGTTFGPFAELTYEQWQRPFDVNIGGHFAVLQAAYPALRKGGSVVAISSGAGHDPLEGLSAYGASKAALNHLATILAQEWGPAKGVRVNVISPGSTAKEPVDYEHLTDRQNETIAATALRRLGTAEDIADVALFFASDLSSFVTGQWVRVNGGRI